MFDLTALDYVYLGVVLASTVWATIRGGVYETVATLSWIIAAITARFVSPFLDGVFQHWFKLSESSVGTLVSSYFIVFFVILVLFGFFNQKLRDRVQESVMNVTDHTLGVIFGIIRGIILMGLAYWAMLWYYSDMPQLPEFISDSRTRPIMQLTAVKTKNWFIPGENKLLERDMIGSAEAVKIYDNLINPRVIPSDGLGAIKTDDKSNAKTPEKTKGADVKTPEKPVDKKTILHPVAVEKKQDTKPVESGYKNSERTALENQLLQIENAANAEEK